MNGNQRKLYLASQTLAWGKGVGWATLSNSHLGSTVQWFRLWEGARGAWVATSPRPPSAPPPPPMH